MRRLLQWICVTAALQLLCTHYTRGGANTAPPYPYSAIGAITTNASDTVCTGALVGRDLVVTLSSCPAVTASGGRQVFFTPAGWGGAAKAPVLKFRWYGHVAEQHMVWLWLATPVGEVTGWFGLSAVCEGDYNFSTAGYLYQQPDMSGIGGGTRLKGVLSSAPGPLVAADCKSTDNLCYEDASMPVTCTEMPSSGGSSSKSGIGLLQLHGAPLWLQQQDSSGRIRYLIRGLLVAEAAPPAAAAAACSAGLASECSEGTSPAAAWQLGTEVIPADLGKTANGRLREQFLNSMVIEFSELTLPGRAPATLAPPGPGIAQTQLSALLRLKSQLQQSADAERMLLLSSWATASDGQAVGAGAASRQRLLQLVPPGTDYCFVFDGVTCDSDYYVTGLVLGNAVEPKPGGASSSSSGRLDLSAFTRLETLVLSGSRKVGAANRPLNLSLLTFPRPCALRVVQLENTESRLPPDLANCQQLMQLGVVYGRTPLGGLPIEYGNLKMLRKLEIYGMFTPIEEQQSASSKVQVNGVTTLPDSWSGMQQLQELIITNYQGLAGTLPASYASWKHIKKVDISSTNITGPLPVEYAAWRGVEIFFLDRNKLSGTLPAEYGPMLRTVSVSSLANNRLIGSIPQTFGQFGADVGYMSPVLWLSDNSGLAGCLPAGLVIADDEMRQDNPDLRRVFVDGTDISGSC